MQHPDVPPVLRDYFDRTGIALALGRGDADHALLLVNPGFSALTGYAPGQAVGRNCRFLQGAGDNRTARAAIGAFLTDDGAQSLRTTLLNVKRDGTRFVNLLYMSKLRWSGAGAPLIFASQFDVSHARAAWLRDYDRELGQSLAGLAPALSASGLIVGGTLTALADSAATIARAKLMLAGLEEAE